MHCFNVLDQFVYSYAVQSYECNSCHDFEFNCAIVQYEYNRLI